MDTRRSTTFRYRCLLVSLFVLAGVVSSVTSVMAEGEALDQIVLNIPAQQVVGHPLVGTSQILLLDDGGGLVIGYDLATDPITLLSDPSGLEPVLINNPALETNGLIDISPVGLQYPIGSATVSIRAANATDTSASVRVSFSGYDLLEARHLSGGPITTVRAGLPVEIEAAVINRGDLTPDTDPSLKSYFLSGGGSIKEFFTGASHGQLDVVTVNLPTSNLVPGEDTLVLVLESSFDPGSGSLLVSDTLWLPVTVLDPVSAELVEGSVGPEAVYPGIGFEIVFDVATVGMSIGPDSADLAVYLLDPDSLIIATAFDGEVIVTEFAGDTLRFGNIPALVPDNLSLAPGTYRLLVELELFLGEQAIMATSSADSLSLLSVPEVDYVSSSFAPTMVASGEEVSFQFGVWVTADGPVEIDTLTSYFTLYGPGGSIQVTLVGEDYDLLPGSNLIHARPVFIASEWFGAQLSAALELEVNDQGSANRVRYLTDFDNANVTVAELPLIQIVGVDVLAPNPPTVNTQQEFQIACRVANLTSTEMGQFELRLLSNGESFFDSLLTVDGVPGDSTIEVIFDIAAANVANPSEIFRVDIATVGVNQLPPQDNIAPVAIQRPAQLAGSLFVRGAADGYVDLGEGFDLLLGIANGGEAEAGIGTFRISTRDIYLGLPDSVLTYDQVVPVGEVRAIPLVAPDFDTVITIDIVLINHPIDINSNAPAPMVDTSFQVVLAVTSLDLSMEVQVWDDISNVVRPGGYKELLRLDLINPGRSSVTAMRIETMALTFSDRDGLPANVWSLIEVGSTGLYDNDRLVTRTTAGGDRLNLLFDDYTVAGGDTVTLSLRSLPKAEPGREFNIALDPADIEVSYAAGPLAGRVVEVIAVGGDSLIFDEPFTAFEASLEGSFMVRNNPWNPSEADAEFRYFLQRSEDVALRILTLTGELVHEEKYTAGSPGAVTGENVAFWDGCHEGGLEVLNGVYVVVLTTELSREKATLKLAVMR